MTTEENSQQKITQRVIRVCFQETFAGEIEKFGRLKK